MVRPNRAALGCAANDAVSAAGFGPLATTLGQATPAAQRKAVPLLRPAIPDLSPASARRSVRVGCGTSIDTLFGSGSSAQHATYPSAVVGGFWRQAHVHTELLLEGRQKCINVPGLLPAG